MFLSIVSHIFVAIFPDLETLQFRFVNYTCRSVNYTFILNMFKILDNIYIWVFLIKSKSALLLAFVKCMLYSHFNQNSKLFLYILEAKSPCFVTKCSKSLYMSDFILAKKQQNWFYKNLRNSVMVGHRKRLNTSLNQISNALSIGVNFDLKYLFII